MFDRLIAQFTRKLGAAVKSVVCAVMMISAGGIALGFFCAAAFLWLQRDYGAIAASLALGGVFLMVAIAAMIVMAVIRNRARQEAEAQAAWWSDPAVLAAGLQAVRTLGERHAAAGVLAAFAIGMLLGRCKPSNSKGRGNRKT